MATAIHTLICLGSLASMMDCDYCILKGFFQGYLVRVNVHFTHSTYEVEEAASVRYSVALTKVRRQSALSGEASRSAWEARAVFGSYTLGSHEYVSQAK